MTRPTAIPAAALPRSAYRARLRVRFAECDPAGIVFFTAWFAIANAAVEDFFLDALAVDFHHLHEQRRIGTGFAHAEADYFRPVTMGEVIALTPVLDRIGGSSYTLRLHVHRGDEEVVRFRLLTATTDLDSRRPVPLPDDLRAALESYRARCAEETA